MIKTHVSRHAGHPWDGLRQNFDRLEFEADTREECERFVANAGKRFWQPWLVGIHDVTGKPGGLLYKPSGIQSDWQDSPENPHPGGLPASS